MDIRRATHQAIQGVSEDIEAFHMNKAVARIRELSNTLMNFKPQNDSDKWALREGYEALVILFNPMMPHLAEELWKELGHNQILTDTSWPSVEQDLLKANSVTVGVQVNGKVKTTITLGSDASKDEFEKEALSQDSVKKALDGMEIKKVIVVPGRIVNVVAG